VLTVPRATRLSYLDWLKVVLVGLIIVWHGVAGYTDLESAWPYQDVQEVSLAELTNNILAALVLPGVLFAMGVFFLISGLVTPGSLARKGPRVFARDRAVRLGVPLAVWVLVVWPLMLAAMQAAVGEPTSYSWELLHGEPFLDTGPMWFVELLLIYSLGYAAWRRWGPRRVESGDRAVELGRTLVALAVGISAATLLVRLVFPLFSGQIAHLQLWQWPQYLAMFGLGIVAARRSWLDPVPERIGRRSALAALLGILAASSWPPPSWPPAASRRSSSSVASTGRRSPWPRSRVRSWSPGRSGCSAWLSATWPADPVRSAAPWRGAPSGRSCSRAWCSWGSHSPSEASTCPPRRRPPRWRAPASPAHSRCPGLW
jgi:hypothetical protein